MARLASAPYLLAMGNTKPHKELPTLLNAFGILAPSFPDLRLLLVGSEPAGYLQSQLKRCATDISERVTFTGPVTTPNCGPSTRAPRSSSAPPATRDSGCRPWRPWQLGAPVVCADAASLPEVVGEAALLFPAGEQGRLATTLARVLRDPVLRADLAAAGTSARRQFTWANTAAATVAVYAAGARQTPIWLGPG